MCFKLETWPVCRPSKFRVYSSGSVLNIGRAGLDSLTFGFLMCGLLFLFHVYTVRNCCQQFLEDNKWIIMATLLRRQYPEVGCWKLSPIP